MEAIVKKRIIVVSKDVLAAVIKKDNFKLKELSNYTIHNASIFQDEDSISIATLTYSLSKIIERHRFTQTKEFLNFHKNVVESLKKLRKELINNNIQNYKDISKRLFEEIEKFDHKLTLYVQKVVEKAKIKKGSAMFEHGISLGQVANLLGISTWQLMSYVGKTTIFDFGKTPGVKERLKFTRKLFGI